MPASSQCPSCHAALAEGLPVGLCPACVSRLLASGKSAARGGSEVDRARPRRRAKWPKRFGDYELIGRVGAGGMGVVYKAHQRRLDRVVALKMIRSARFAGSRETRRFRAEADVIARLDHPHIVPLYEVGELRGRHFFSMLLVESGSMLTHMPRLQKDHRRAAQVLATVARAVHYAHQHGILHRDLKPANILLDSQDQPYVSDFGLARDLNDNARLTQTGVVVGTPAYMAPEQAMGGGTKGSPEADVYSLGAILYELLTRQPPFAPDPLVASAGESGNRPPRPPRSINGRVNPDLEAICLKCLEKDPVARYPTAEALALDLERFLRDEPVGARPASRPAALVQWSRRRPVPATLLTLAALLLAGWAAGSLAMAARLYRLRPPPPNDPPVVVLMDTPADKGVYDPEVQARSGTNADVLNELLSTLEVQRVREPVTANWRREDSILGLHPDLVIIHRSCYFHALVKEFNALKGFILRYPEKSTDPLDPQWELLYETMDDRLISFLGAVAMDNPNTRFLVYSRGTDPQWLKDQYRKEWVERAEHRFPKLKGRIRTQVIEGGLDHGSFTNPEVAKTTRKNVQELLGLPKARR